MALTVYTVALLVRVVADGLKSVDPLVTEAASAMGYRRLRRLVSVELPIALPVILAGLRVATVANISLVSVGALIGVGGLGALFTRGSSSYYTPPIVVGIVLSVLLAAVCRRGHRADPAARHAVDPRGREDRRMSDGLLGYLLDPANWQGGGVRASIPAADRAPTSGTRCRRSSSRPSSRCRSGCYIGHTGKGSFIAINAGERRPVAADAGAA